MQNLGKFDKLELADWFIKFLKDRKLKCGIDNDEMKAVYQEGIESIEKTKKQMFTRR